MLLEQCAPTKNLVPLLPSKNLEREALALVATKISIESECLLSNIASPASSKGIMQYPRLTSSVVVLLYFTCLIDAMIAHKSHSSSATNAVPETQAQSWIDESPAIKVLQIHSQSFHDPSYSFLAKRVAGDVEPFAQCKLVMRHPFAVVLPGTIGVSMLQNFWLKIALLATDR